MCPHLRLSRGLIWLLPLGTTTRTFTLNYILNFPGLTFRHWNLLKCLRSLWKPSKHTCSFICRSPPFSFTLRIFEGIFPRSFLSSLPLICQLCTVAFATINPPTALTWWIPCCQSWGNSIVGFSYSVSWKQLILWINHSSWKLFPSSRAWYSNLLVSFLGFCFSLLPSRFHLTCLP